MSTPVLVAIVIVMFFIMLACLPFFTMLSLISTMMCHLGADPIYPAFIMTIGLFLDLLRFMSGSWWSKPGI